MPKVTEQVFANYTTHTHTHIQMYEDVYLGIYANALAHKLILELRVRSGWQWQAGVATGGRLSQRPREALIQVTSGQTKKIYV